jgi:hypothetical protein
LDRFSGGNGKDDAGVLDLEPGQVASTRHRMEDREIGSGDDQGARFSAWHGLTSDA